MLVYLYLGRIFYLFVYIYFFLFVLTVIMIVGCVFMVAMFFFVAIVVRVKNLFILICCVIYIDMSHGKF